MRWAKLWQSPTMPFQLSGGSISIFIYIIEFWPLELPAQAQPRVKSRCPGSRAGLQREGAAPAAITAPRNSRVSLTRDKLLTHIFSFLFLIEMHLLQTHAMPCPPTTTPPVPPRDGFASFGVKPICLPYYLITLKCSLQCFSTANAIPKVAFSKRAQIPSEDTDVDEEELKPSLTARAVRAPREQGHLSPAVLKARKKARSNSKAIT